MPKLITTRTRTTDLGIPGIISLTEDSSELGAMNEGGANVDLIDNPCHSILRTFRYFIPLNFLKTISVNTGIPETPTPAHEGSTYQLAYSYRQNSLPVFLDLGMHH